MKRIVYCFLLLEVAQFLAPQVLLAEMAIGDHACVHFCEKVTSGEYAGWMAAELKWLDRDDHTGLADAWYLSYENLVGFAAIPVTGCGTAKIKPVVIMGSMTAACGVSASVLTDEEMFKRMKLDVFKKSEFVVGHSDYSMQDPNSRGWKYELTRSDKKVALKFSAGIWPDWNPVAGRQWILVTASRMPGFSGAKFAVGVLGTDLVSPVMTVGPDWMDEGGQSSITAALPKFTTKDIWGFESSFSGGTLHPPWAVFWEDSNLSVYLRHGEDFHRFYYELDCDSDLCYPNGSTFSFKAPSAGRFYVEDDNEIGNGFVNILCGGRGEVSMTPSSCGGFNCYGNGAYLEVPSAGQVKIKLPYFGAGCCVGMWFFPSGVRSVGFAADQWEWTTCANGRKAGILRCYCTGLGATAVSAQAKITANLSAGEVFDHWEFVNCAAPAGADLTANPLTFTVTEQMAALDGEFPIVHVRPVLKERCILSVIPIPCGAATVKGNGAYVAGTEVDVTLVPDKNCTLKGWRDGAGDGLKRTLRIKKGSEIQTYYVDFNGTPSGAGAATETQDDGVTLPPSYPPFVLGIPIDSIDTGLIGYSVKGLPSGLKYEKTTGLVSGTPKKMTGVNGAQVTFSKKGCLNKITCLYVNGESVTCEIATTNLIAGVALSEPIKVKVECETGVKSVSLSNLPVGLKYDKKTGTITGVPTKSGVRKVTVTVVTTGGTKNAFPIGFVVDTQASVAVGNFNGFLYSGASQVGLFTASASQTGVISAKAQLLMGKPSFKVKCWTSVDAQGVYTAEAATKKGEKLTFKVDAGESLPWDSFQASGTVTIGSETYTLRAQRDPFLKIRGVYENNEAGNALTPFLGKQTMDDGLILDVKNTGKATLAGKTADGIKVSGSSTVQVIGGKTSVGFVTFPNKQVRVFSYELD